jgi:hypothetical protein
MTLTFSELEPASDDQDGEWPYRRRAIFLGSTAYDTLERELYSYVDGTIAGRSFLIAAHRGVGKTSLVLRAVQDIERARVLEAANKGAPIGLQRPLLVKLHGSSLLAPAEPPKPTADKPPADPSQKVAAAVADAIDRLTGPQQTTPAGPPKASAEIALQQITIALYRSLAREVADAFTWHATVQAHGPSVQRGNQSPQDLLELAGQLTLDLDLAPDVSALRRAWARLGRLGAGVIWPRPHLASGPAGPAPAQRGLTEIVAIATANQAFQVCSGRVEATQSAKDSAEREASAETRAKLDFKDVANRFWALTAGALVGAAALQATTVKAAVAAGAVTTVVSSLSLGWSVTRRARRERSTDYTFIMDRTIQTLDRDLPVVIERVRAAGLAPVFLIDELDKLEQPTECIAAIIRRLKNLTTDYGFFCFLTDRGYYEEIERKLREEAYPAEHTFFSHRLLVLYRPAELARYVHSLWSPDPSTGEPREAQTQAQARWVLTCACLHRGKLNLTDIRREIARLCDRNGLLNVGVDIICGAGEFLLPMAMQLALEHVLRQKEIRRRVEVNNAFAQLAFEVLYVIARVWHEGRDTVDLGLEAVRAELIGQRRLEGNAAAQKEQLAKVVPEADLITLVSKAKVLAELLADFKRIRERILLEREFLALPDTPAPGPFDNTEQSEPAKLAALSGLLLAMPGDSPGLLARQDSRDGEAHVFRFLFDSYGVERSGDPLEAQIKIIRAAIRYVEQVEAALRECGCTLLELFQGGVLPATLNPAAIADSIARLRDADPEMLEAMQADVTLIRGIPSTLGGISLAVVELCALTANIRGDAGRLAGDVTVAEALRSTDQLLGNIALVELLSAAPSRSGQRPRIKSPNSEVADALTNASVLTGIEDPAAWPALIAAERERLSNRFPVPDAAFLPVAEAWRVRLSTWLAQRANNTGQTTPPTAPPILYLDTVCLAAGLLLPGLLRPDLGTLTIAEWSRFCMLMDRAGPGAPAWALVAGLAALGFGRTVLHAAIDRAASALGVPPVDLEATVGSFLEAAPDDRPHILLITATGSRLGDTVPNLAEQLTFAVPEDHANDYVQIVAWLAENGSEQDAYQEQI